MHHPSFNHIICVHVLTRKLYTQKYTSELFTQGFVFHMWPSVARFGQFDTVEYSKCVSLNERSKRSSKWNERLFKYAEKVLEYDAS